MKPVLTLVLLLLLTACTQSLKPNTEVAIKPCVIPNNQPNNAMGKLGIQTIRVDNIYRIIIPIDNVFETQSVEIKDSAYPGLTQLAGYLNGFIPTKMAVTGYTDSLGSYPYDQTLSEKQARSLITFLWTKGLPHECLTPIGIGKDENYTIASNRSVDGSIANRRIEITFTARSHAFPLFR